MKKLESFFTEIKEDYREGFEEFELRTLFLGFILPIIALFIVVIIIIGSILSQDSSDIPVILALVSFILTQCLAMTSHLHYLRTGFNQKNYYKISPKTDIAIFIVQYFVLSVLVLLSFNNLILGTVVFLMVFIANLTYRAFIEKSYKLLGELSSPKYIDFIKSLDIPKEMFFYHTGISVYSEKATKNERKEMSKLIMSDSEYVKTLVFLKEISKSQEVDVVKDIVDKLYIRINKIIANYTLEKTKKESEQFVNKVEGKKKLKKEINAKYKEFMNDY